MYRLRSQVLVMRTSKWKQSDTSRILMLLWEKWDAKLGGKHCKILQTIGSWDLASQLGRIDGLDADSPQIPLSVSKRHSQKDQKVL